MDQWLQFAQEQWLVLVIALVAIIVILKVLKAVVKWVLVLAIVAAIVYYGFDYTEQLKEVGGQVMDYAVQHVFDAMAGEAANAQYTAGANGSFTVVSDNLTIRGQIGSEEVEIEFRGQRITLKINEAIQTYIDRAQSNSAA